MTIYAGTIKNGKINKIQIGHANHIHFQAQESFHTHDGNHFSQFVPSVKDIIFLIQPLKYNLKYHYIITNHCVWKLKPNNKLTKKDLSSIKYLENNIKLFKQHNYINLWKKELINLNMLEGLYFI